MAAGVVYMMILRCFNPGFAARGYRLAAGQTLVVTVPPHLADVNLAV
jgi:hypothetical protein